MAHGRSAASRPPSPTIRHPPTLSPSSLAELEKTLALWTRADRPGSGRDCEDPSVPPPGVDLVLNSLAEEKLQASVRCLAQHGRFLEIGKVDLSNNNPLGEAGQWAEMGGWAGAEGCGEVPRASRGPRVVSPLPACPPATQAWPSS